MQPRESRTGFMWGLGYVFMRVSVGCMDGEETFQTQLPAVVHLCFEIRNPTPNKTTDLQTKPNRKHAENGRHPPEPCLILVVCSKDFGF